MVIDRRELASPHADDDRQLLAVLAGLQFSMPKRGSLKLRKPLGSLSQAGYGGMAKATKAKPSGEEAHFSIRDLVSYRLARTSSLMSRGAALRYRRLFDVSLGEWRALALLAAEPGMSLVELSQAAGLDKAQMSRVITALIARGLVLRATTSRRGRAVELSLTLAGRDVYSGLIAEAEERDTAFRAVLSPKELALLQSALDKLAAQAKAFIRAESSLEEDEASADGEEPPEA